MPARALLFDFDGVIADTENIHIAAWQRVFGMMGWEATDESCAPAVEMDDRVFLARIFDEKKIVGGDVPGWVLRKQKVTLDLMADSPRVYPGIAELLAWARGRFKLGVVTTTWRDNVTTVLRASGLLASIDLIVAKEDVVATKPAPEPYKLAVKSLGVPARSTVAFEDSPDGLASARGAGLCTVAVGHRRPIGSWMGDSPYLTHFRDTQAVMELLSTVE
jgi:beta-phosphoglucomutase